MLLFLEYFTILVFIRPYIDCLKIFIVPVVFYHWFKFLKGCFHDCNYHPMKIWQVCINYTWALETFWIVFQNKIYAVWIFRIFISSHQKFVLMKTSWRRLSSSSSEERLDQDKYIHLSRTSSRRLGQDQYIRLHRTSSIGLQDVFKTSSRRLQDVLKTPSRRLAKTLLRHLQDIFKTSCKDISKMFSRCFNKLNCSC